MAAPGPRAREHPTSELGADEHWDSWSYCMYTEMHLVCKLAELENTKLVFWAEYTKTKLNQY